ncbi:hypothetical protein ES703_75411 [subsurface metagenome]
MPGKGLRLHVGEVQAEAHVRAAAERHPGEAVAVARCFIGKAHRIELVRIRPDFRHVVGVERVDADRGAGGNVVALEGEVAHRAARHRGHRRLQPQRFLERHFRQRHLFQIVDAGGIVGLDAEPLHLVAQPLLPFGVGGELADERRQRRCQCVMGRHHQEAHVVDDVLRRQQRAVLMGGLAQLREQVVAAALAPDRDLLGEIGDDAFAPGNTAAHLGERQRRADRCDRSGDHVDKGAGDVVDLRPDFGAEEGGRRQIQRELFHRRIHQHLAGLRFPLLDARGNAAIEIDEIGLHRPRLERHRQRAAVQAVLLEIQQHQPARKQQAEDRSPAMGVRELPRLVEQHEFVGFGPEQGDAGLAEQAGPVDVAVFGGRGLDRPLGIGQDLQRVADERPAFIAGNVPQRLRLRRRYRHGRGNHRLHRHGSRSV